MTLVRERANAIRTTPAGGRRLIALGSFALALVVVAAWGGRLNSRLHLGLDAAPLYAAWMPRLGTWIVLALAVASVVLVVDERSAPGMSFCALVAASTIAAAAWGVSLALADGTHGLVMGLDSRHHGYLNVLDRLPGPAEFLRTFTDRIAGYPTHVRGHPPGVMVGLLWLHRAGLATPGTVAAILIAAGASIPAAAMLAVRDVTDEHTARRVAPFLVLAPAAIWLVSNLDALYAAVGAWAVVLFVRGRRSDMYAFAGGVVFGVGVFLSYGLAPLAIVPAVLLVGARRWRAIVLAAIGAGAVVVVFAAFGFWWPDGLAATGAEYAKGIAAVRPYAYFLIANLVVFALIVGVGAIAGLATGGDRRVWLLAGPALVTVAVANVSGMSKGEVERIWLPFWPFVALLAAWIPAPERRAWLIVQALVGVAIPVLLFVP